MKDRTVCFTGHRRIPASQMPEVSKKLRTVVVDLINRGYCHFAAGGALGFDTLAAEVVLSLREAFPHIDLTLALPCPDQTKGWTEESVRRYEEIKGMADKVVYTSRKYAYGCMQKRNRYLVDHSCVCVCYLTERSGGTFYTVNYAAAKSLCVINIAE